MIPKITKKPTTKKKPIVTTLDKGEPIFGLPVRFDRQPVDQGD